MAEKEKLRSDLKDLTDQLPLAIARTFKGSREGFQTVDVDEYLKTRDLLLILFRVYDAEVYRVCFEERLSNRSCYGGD
jgi:hypothetical protein